MTFCVETQAECAKLKVLISAERRMDDMSMEAPPDLGEMEVDAAADDALLGPRGRENPDVEGGHEEREDSEDEELVPAEPEEVDEGGAGGVEPAPRQ